MDRVLVAGEGLGFLVVGGLLALAYYKLHRASGRRLSGQTAFEDKYGEDVETTGGTFE